MPWRFRKVIRLGKGVNLNLSRRGPSVSAGIPGSGLRWYSGHGGKGRPSAGFGCGSVLLILVGVIVGLPIVGAFMDPRPSPAPAYKAPSRTWDPPATRPADSDPVIVPARLPLPAAPAIAAEPASKPEPLPARPAEADGGIGFNPDLVGVDDSPVPPAKAAEPPASVSSGTVYSPEYQAELKKTVERRKARAGKGNRAETLRKLREANTPSMLPPELRRFD